MSHVTLTHVPRSNLTEQLDMSESQSQVFLFNNSDPAMQTANEKARESFRYFWREVFWERHRIIPALDLACVKLPFADGRATKKTDHPNVEQMWISEIDFDGQFVSGVLQNSPNWVKSVKAGDRVRRPVSEISDWMFAMSDRVYGAFTVNLMRFRMSEQERAGHDRAWGLDFGDPSTVRVPTTAKSGDSDYPEHPVSENMAPSLQEAISKDSNIPKSKDKRGWTYLHNHSLAGSAATVKVLLDGGADVNAATEEGLTALQLARSQGWTKVVDLLLSKGAK
ncbi:MAG: DUF2314 domain-containing protein [Gemmataceae bacterium]